MYLMSPKNVEKDVVTTIDKNGKLFGKINIIDIIIVILLLVALMFVVYKLGLFAPKQAISTEANKIRIVFYQEEVNTFTVENTNLNDPVTDAIQNNSFGKVVDIESGESSSWGVDKDGKQVMSAKDGYSSIYITAETTGTVSSTGISTGGANYYVGQLLTVRVGTSAYYCRIYSAESVEED